MTSQLDPSNQFTSRSEIELYDLDELGLVLHVRDAKLAGDTRQAELAVYILLFKHERRMQRRVATRLPDALAHHADVVADWVLKRIARSALKLAFEGTSVGEWVKWWQTAVDRQVISFLRSKEGKGLAIQVALPSELDDQVDTLGEELDVERLVNQLCYEEIVQAALAGMDNDLHREIVQLAFWEDQTSADVAASCGTSAVNVDKIKSRFRERVREECARRGVTES
jgi:DNA-directed RNA polymerase specialized sigma24 family protein